MPVTTPIEPITASDADLRKVLEDAHLPALIAALAQDTGDFSLLRDDLIPDTGVVGRALGGFMPDQQVRARELAFDALVAFRDGGCVARDNTSQADLRRLIDYVAGGETSDEYVPLLEEELAFPNEDARAPKWNKEQIAPGTPFSVAVIGAGMSGIVASIRLKQAGVPFTIIEKNRGIGGTWWENTYPGARVDNANHMYSYSFAQKVDWPSHFSTQGVLQRYFSSVAEEYGLLPNIRFGTEVESATYDEARALWTLTLRSGGKTETLEANAVISAVGQLNRPNMPDIPGIGTFEGPAFHSARWDDTVDLHGRRVAVIGNGASASQLIPEVAKEAGELLIFQRTPTWYAPVPNYHEAVPEGLQWLFRHVPHYAQWYRFWLFWTSAEGLLPSARVDADWDGDPNSIGKANDEVRALFTGYLQGEFADRPDLLAKVVPHYAPASKRIVLDNGIWARTLKRDNVQLITEHVDAITPRGVKTADGQEHEVDVIIFGTGFQASKFLTPMKVVGRTGRDLNEQWEGDARAYLGITVPDFPNLFLMYGPNTNIVVNGSIVYFSECETNYILGSIKMLLAGKHRAMDVKRDVHDAYNERVDAENMQMAWGVAEVPSWYRNAKGRTAQNWPFSLLEYWQCTRQPNPADYEFA